MKKSEMELELDTFMRSIADENANNSASQAEEILDFLVSKGMLPPKCWIYKKVDIVINRVLNPPGSSAYNTVEVNEWELEDGN